MSTPAPWPPNYAAWLRSDEGIAASYDTPAEFARKAWNAAITAALAELEYMGAGEDPDGDRVRAVESLRAE